MATLKRSGARKPLAVGAVHAASTYIENVHHYTVVVDEPGGPPYRHLELALTEREMLSVMADWMARFVMIQKGRT